MVTITSLWLPILVSAAFVWIASAIVWMVLPHHKSDFGRVTDEEAARNALRDLQPGQYNIPHLTSREELQQPEGKRKFEEGPVGFLTILPRGVPPMGRNLVLMFAYNIVVGVAVAYVAGRSLAAGTDYLQVFRITGTVSLLAYGMAIVPDAVWFGRPWSYIGKNGLDALFYALVTAGVFGWLWPG